MTTDKSNGDKAAENNEKRIFRIAVGSANPCKVDAVRQALKRVIQKSHNLQADLEVEGFSVGSGVPDQPFGDEETQHGAKSRAEHAYQAYKKKNGVAPHLAVGLEGGLEWSKTIPDENGHDSLWCMAWMALYGKRNAFVVDLLASPDSKFYQPDKKPIFGMAKTGTFLLPSSLAALIEDGMELGDADDKVFGRVNSKQGSGTVGVLTDGLIDRARYYEHALILALVPWMRPDVYSSKEELSIGSRLFCRSGSR